MRVIPFWAILAAMHALLAGVVVVATFVYVSNEARQTDVESLRAAQRQATSFLAENIALREEKAQLQAELEAERKEAAIRLAENEEALSAVRLAIANQQQLEAVMSLYYFARHMSAGSSDYVEYADQWVELVDELLEPFRSADDVPD